MSTYSLIQSAIAGLRTNRTRSALTILGIVIGITAIVLVMSVGSGVEGLIGQELGGLGGETVVIRPGKEPSGPSDFAEAFFSDSLKERELQAILHKGNVPDLIDASPEVIVSGPVSYRGETFRPLTLGFSGQFMLDALDLTLASGRVFDERELRANAKVAVLGDRVVRELFHDREPLGEQISIKGQKFRVIGTFAERGRVVFFDVDELVLIPYTSAQAYLVGSDYFPQIVARASSPETVSRAVRDIQATLRELHNITDASEDDFYVQTQQGLLEQVESIIGVFTIFLSFVIAISLVVGGVGVMNIMLVTVTERTHEIGLRKAVGATDTDILALFLLEAIILTALGGLLGVLFGAGLAGVASFFITKYTTFALPFVFPVGAAIIGVLVSSLVGLVFGLYPARKAARLSPMEALRYE